MSLWENKNKIIHACLGVLILFAVLSRVWVLDYAYQIDSARVVEPDTVRYEEPALSLLKNGTLLIAPHDKDTKDLAQGPGYSLMIAGVYKLIGERNHFALLVAQVLLGVLTIWAVYLIGALLWTPLAGLIAAAFMTISPMQYYYSMLMMTEIPFALFAVLAVFFGIKLLKNTDNKYKKWALLLGLSLAVATLFKTISLYLGFLVIVGMLVGKLFLSKTESPLKLSGKTLLQSSILIILPFALIIGGWTVRNGMATDAYIYTDNSGTNMLNWRAGNVISVKDQIPIKEAQRQLHDKLKGTYTTLAERVRAEEALSKEILLANLDIWWEITTGRYGGAYATIMDTGMPGITKLLGDPLSNEKLRIEMQRENMKANHLWFKSLDLFAKINLVLLYSFAVIGFIAAIRNKPRQRILHVFIMGVILYYYIITFGHEGAGYSRGRMTFIPLVMLYSGYGVAVIIQALRHYKSKSHEDDESLKSLKRIQIRDSLGYFGAALNEPSSNLQKAAG